jgi:hypothetical protein
MFLHLAAWVGGWNAFLYIVFEMCFYVLAWMHDFEARHLLCI